MQIKTHIDRVLTPNHVHEWDTDIVHLKLSDAWNGVGWWVRLAGGM